MPTARLPPPLLLSLLLLSLLLLWCAGPVLTQEFKPAPSAVNIHANHKPVNSRTIAAAFPVSHKPVKSTTSSVSLDNQKPVKSTTFNDSPDNHKTVKSTTAIDLPTNHKTVNVTTTAIGLLDNHKPVNVPTTTIDFPDKYKPVNVSKICFQRQCICKGRVATCDCRGKGLNLASDHFTGDDIVELNVRGASHACVRVKVKPNTFYSSSVKRVKMEGLKKIKLEENSFRTRPKQHQFVIEFHNVEELVMVSHSFSGLISSISFINTTTSVPGKAFVGTSGASTNVTFKNSTLSRISSHAFAGSRLSSLEFVGCDIDLVDKDGISPQQLSACRLTNCTVRRLESFALRLSLQTLEVRQCRFRSVASGALAARFSGNTWLHNNTFEKVAIGSFSQLDPADSGARLEFHDNRLLELAPGALSFSANFSADQLSVLWLWTTERCRCHLGSWLRLMSGAAANWLQLKLSAAVHCQATPGHDTAFLRFLKTQCQSDGPPPAPASPAGWKRYIVGVAVAAALVAVLCAVSCLAVWWHSRRRRQRHCDATAALQHRPLKLNNTNLYSDGPSGAGGGGGGWGEPPESSHRPLVLAMPDVKTYTETELQVVLETLESIEPTVLPRISSTGTLQRLKRGDGPRRSSETDEPQSPGCRKSCPL